MLLRRKTPLLSVAVLMLASGAMVALFASAALAQTPSDSASASATGSTTASVTATAGSTTAATISAAASVSPSATASATASASALSRTGGSSHILPVTIAASLALVLSGLTALGIALRRGAS